MRTLKFEGRTVVTSMVISSYNYQINGGLNCAVYQRNVFEHDASYYKFPQCGKHSGTTAHYHFITALDEYASAKVEHINQNGNVESVTICVYRDNRWTKMWFPVEEAIMLKLY